MTSQQTRKFLWPTLFAVVYIVSRTYAMTHIPVFIDEAIHVDWSRATLDSMPAPPGFDGKWLTIKLFALATAFRWPFDDLIAARLVVVTISLTSALACYLLARDLFSRRAGVISVALYLVLPFTVIYTSIAMTDGIQLALSAWSILLSVRLARSSHWSYVVILPLVLASAILAKFSALTLIAMPVIAVLVLAPRRRWVGALLRAAPAVLTCLGLFLVFNRLGMLQIVAHKMIRGAASMERTWMNLLVAGNWLWGLLTPTIAVLAIGAVLWLLLWERSRPALFVVALLAVTVLPYVAISETWYPRYLLVAVIPVLLAVSHFLASAIAMAERHSSGRRTMMAIIISLCLVLSWPILRSGAILFDLPDAGIPELERYQLVTGWPSGYGVRELADFLREQGERTKGGIAVARLHWWDHPLQGLNIYLTDSPEVSLYTIDYRELGSLAALARLSTERRTLLVLSTEHGLPLRLPERMAPALKCGRAIWSYTRPGNLTGLVVYELACGELTAVR